MVTGNYKVEVIIKSLIPNHSVSLVYFDRETYPLIRRRKMKRDDWESNFMEKKIVKKETSVAKTTDKNKAIWLGSQSLMGNVVPNSKESKERALVNMTARVLDVSPFGVNILGNLPYINNLGLSQKSKQYGKGKDQFKYNWIQRALGETEKAICECKIVRDGKDITDWITGECSPKTMKMSTLSGYQNHMAQTRAKNRAIKEAYGVDIHEDMMENIHNFYDKKIITEGQKNALEYHAGKATSTSSEEIQLDKDTKSAPINNDLFGSVVVAPVKGPGGEPVFVCAKCDEIVDEQVAKFSKKMYGRILCREDQKTAKRK